MEVGKTPRPSACMHQIRAATFTPLSKFGNLTARQGSPLQTTRTTAVWAQRQIGWNSGSVRPCQSLRLSLMKAAELELCPVQCACHSGATFLFPAQLVSTGLSLGRSLVAVASGSGANGNSPKVGGSIACSRYWHVRTNVLGLDHQFAVYEARACCTAVSVGLHDSTVTRASAATDPVARGDSRLDQGCWRGRLSNGSMYNSFGKIQCFRGSAALRAIGPARRAGR